MKKKILIFTALFFMAVAGIAVLFLHVISSPLFWLNHTYQKYASKIDYKAHYYSFEQCLEPYIKEINLEQFSYQKHVALAEIFILKQCDEEINSVIQDYRDHSGILDFDMLSLSHDFSMMFAAHTLIAYHPHVEILKNISVFEENILQKP